MHALLLITALAWNSLQFGQLLEQTGTVSDDTSRLRLAAVVVRNADGLLVEGLQAEDFIVEEGGQDREVVHFESEPSQPMSLGILIDNSGPIASCATAGPVSCSNPTINPQFPAVGGRNVARALVRIIRQPEDAVRVMFYESELRDVYEFTDSPLSIDEFITSYRAPNRPILETSPAGLFVPDLPSFRDTIGAVTDALEKIREAPHGRRALIVISPFVDRGRQNIQTLRAGVSAGVSEGVPVFPIHLIRDGLELGARPDFVGPDVAGGTRALGGAAIVLPSFELNMPPSVLRDMLATETGGASLVVDLADGYSDESIEKMLSFGKELETSLRGQYVVGYRGESLTEGALRPGVRIRIRGADHRVTLVYVYENQ